MDKINITELSSMYGYGVKIEKGNLYLKINQETECELFNPREGFDIGTMVCFSNDYNLGDDHDYDDPDKFFDYLVWKHGSVDRVLEKHGKGFSIELTDEEEGAWYPWSICDPEGREVESFSTEEEAKDKMDDVVYEYLMDEYTGYLSREDMVELVEEFSVILPLYLYDHSGITMKTSPFGCRWDSGQVGWIYATKERFMKETGYTEKELFEEGKARSILEGEVETYDTYLRGEIYLFIAGEYVKCECCGHTEEETKDSCGGFYGDNVLDNGMEEYVPESHRELLEAYAKDRGYKQSA